jgi:XTP/dITP diphosphohydrolase
MQLLIATTNPGKVREYAALFRHPDLEIVGLRDLGLENTSLDEPFDTYEANAVHKAVYFARSSGLLTLADDSGLEVAALDGRPGVHTARYAGDGASDRDRYLKLLNALESVPDAQRAARFVCAIAVMQPGRDQPWQVRGECTGRIARAPGTGAYGFGFDPVFIPDGYSVTFDHLPPEEKDRISHRGRAAALAWSQILAPLIGER